jgi:serine/threonine protein kinase
MSLVPGQTIGKYEIIGILDIQKTGVTYKVRDKSTQAFEVLRTLPGGSSTDSESVERFLRDIKVHSRLLHPNIVAFYDALQLDGRLVMTGEYVEGSTLAVRLSRGPLGVGEAIRCIADLLCGLEEAHSLGIVHRGITSDNIVITRDNTVKLGGFGLAKPVTDMNLTRVGSVLGNPRYIAPEQVTGQNPVDARADLYSAGVVLYEALTGRVPFEGRSDYEIMVAQVSSGPGTPSRLNPAIPPALDEVVMKALAKDPAERFQSAREFQAALQTLASRLHERAAADSTPAAPRVRARLVFGAVSAVIGLVILFLAMHRL